MPQEVPFDAPKALRPGSVVSVVAPSGPFDRDLFMEGVRRLETRYEVRFRSEIFSQNGYLAGSDARREQELLEAIRDPRIDAIVCARGGFGATRLLDHLDVATVRRANKLLVGFSDITALHALWTRARIRSIHGSMVSGLARTQAHLVSRWFDVVEGEPPKPSQGLTCLAPGLGRGLLVGGNLSVLCALLGTPYAPEVEGRVLFLEDVGEQPYRVDRMLTTLSQAGFFRRVSAVVLGTFTESRPGRDGVTVTDVLRERFAMIGKPVLMGLPAGHVDDNLELPFGAEVEVDADKGTLTFLEAATERELRSDVA